MSTFERDLDEQLQRIRAAGLHRSLRCVESPQGSRIEVEDRSLWNFSSNDYLGLANHPALKEAAINAIHRFGAGAGASRLICGSLRPHHELEQALASFKSTQAVLSFSSGYAAAVGTICALVSRGDAIILDKLVHASIVDAARLSGATIRVFPHNNVEALERLLRSTDRIPAAGAVIKGRTLIVVESVYSMDGDVAPLREIADVKDAFGAWLMVDEAHGTGVLGEGGRGLAELLQLSGRIEVQMGTLGKALGAAGGYICGSSALIELLINRARAFIFSTAPVPAAAAAATAALRLLQSDEGRRRLSDLRALIDTATGALSPATGHSLSRPPTAILPIIIGDERQAVQLSESLRARGFFVPAIRHPAVARGKARLRLTLTAAHESAPLKKLLEALDELRGNNAGVPAPSAGQAD